MKKKLCIVFSFRNEAENLDALFIKLDELKVTLKQWEIKLIFVNDNSNDNSLEILLNYKNKFDLTIINMSRRFGQSACVFAGFEMSDGDATIYMDCDLQDPPELIEKLIVKFEEGYDVVHTLRTKRSGESKTKMLQGFTSCNHT